jgi:archaellum biogenesis ATPase FlaH
MTTPSPSPDRLPDPDLFEDRSHFGAALTAVRERAGLSVRDVAKALRIPPATAGDYCSGRTLPPARMAPVLTDFLRLCEVDDSAVVEAWQRALLRLRHCCTHTGPVPYPGFAPFQRQDSRWFHGRDRLVEEVRGRVEDGRGRGAVVAVVGPSGSGKSSLLRAGLLPALPDWTAVVTTPRRNPCRELSDQLCRSLAIDVDDLDHALHTDQDAMADLVRLSAARASAGLVLVVDQFEELFRERHDDRVRRTFLTALRTITAASGVVVVGLRSDATAEVSGIDLLASAARVEVTPMNEVELREAIERPARAAGRPLESGLVEILVRDMAPRRGRDTIAVAHDPGALGLLSQALLTAWRQRKRGQVTVADYLAGGGVRGMSAAVLDALPAQHQDGAERVLRSLVTGECGDPDAEVVDLLVARRLLTADHGMIAPSHDSVVSAFPRGRDSAGSLAPPRAAG